MVTYHMFRNSVMVLAKLTKRGMDDRVDISIWNSGYSVASFVSETYQKDCEELHEEISIYICYLVHVVYEQFSITTNT